MITITDHMVQNYVSGEMGVELCHTPFTHCVVPGFLQGDDSVQQLKQELLDLDFVPKNNDLYKFTQV